MLGLEELRGKHIAIATPCYGGLVCQNYLMSMIKLIYAVQPYGINLSFIVRGGDSLIPRTRNSIVAEFMATEGYTHLLWIDADIGYEPEQIFRLLRADRDVAAGVYPLKRIMWPDVIPGNMTRKEFDAQYTKYPFNPIAGAKIDEDGFIEVLDAPTGMMMIKKEVFYKLKDAYPNLKIIADEMPGLEAIKDKIAAWDYAFFDVMTEPNGRYLSEDYAFCRRWQQISGRIFVDAASNLTHQGTHIYTGNFLESLKAWTRNAQDAAAKQKAEADAAAERAAKALAEQSATPPADNPPSA